MEKIKSNQEKLDLKIKIATQDDWQTCKDLRLFSITAEDKELFGLTPEKLEEEKNKNEQEWREESSSDEMFSVLAFVGSEAIGLGRVKKDQGESWRIRNAYIKPEFRRKGIGEKILATRLKEIIRIGGKKAVTNIEVHNIASINLAEKFGFKKISKKDYILEGGKIWTDYRMELNNLKDPEIIRKINEVLNAR